MKMIILVGSFGAGKTTLLNSLLNRFHEVGQKIPPVIINEFGERNLDEETIRRGNQSIEIEGIPRGCIACGSRDEYVSLVKSFHEKDIHTAITEPTGAFKIDELPRIQEELPFVSFRVVYLLSAQNTIGLIHSGNTLAGARAIALTHTARAKNVESLRQALQESYHIPVYVLGQKVSGEILDEIWNTLVSESKVFHNEHEDSHHGCSKTGCSHHKACGHNHGHSSDDGGHHHNDEYSYEIDLAGWEHLDLLAFLLSLINSDVLLRYKGCSINPEGKPCYFEWAHGTFTSRVLPEDTYEYRGWLASRTELEPSRFEKSSLHDQHYMRTLEGAIPPVVIQPTDGQQFGTIDPIDPEAWAYLYSGTRDASPEIQKEAGELLVERHRSAACYLREGDLSIISPDSLNYTRLVTVMVWLFWNQEFNLRLTDEDRSLIVSLLQDLEVDKICTEKLAIWMGPSYRYLSRLCEQFPQFEEKLLKIAEIMNYKM